MSENRWEVQISDERGVLYAFGLANDPKTDQPLFETEILTPIQQATQTVGEAGYANFLPHINGVYNQPDLSDGMGVKYQRDKTDSLFKRYYYTEWLDASVPGQIQKGPNVKTLTAPTNSGPMTGYFELGGVPYLVLSRIIARYTSGTDTLSQVRDMGGGGIASSGAIYNRDGTESAADTSAGTGASDTISTGDKRIGQQVRSATAGIQYVGRIDCQLQRTGLAAVSTPVVTTKGAAGLATFGYKVTAIVPNGETAASAQGSNAAANATLTTTNFNTVAVNQVVGATGYKFYRTLAAGATSPTTTGLIGTSSLPVFSDTGLEADGLAPPTTDTSGQILGDARLSVMSDLNGRPSMQIISSASVLANDVPTSAGTVSFRFDDDDTYAVAFNEPFWLVLDVASATTAAGIAWTRSTTDTYSRGTGAVSTDRGNSWTNNASSTDYVFTLYTKTATDTAYVGADDNSNLLATSTDGITFTPDSFRYSALVCTVADRIVRDVRGNGTSQRGAIQYSTDGANWSEPLPIGDINTQITWLGALGKVLIVAKTDSLWAVDVVDATITGVAMQQLYYSNPTATNGQGSCIHKGTAYIPLNGRLMAVQGDFIFGFTVYTSVGPEGMDDWDFPWGAGRVVACAGSRYHLYALTSATGGYRLLKTKDPIQPVTDGQPGRKWHGSIATVGDGSQTVTEMHVFDPGGTGSPRLFCTTTGNNVAEVILSRFENPAADTLYQYDNANTGKLLYPRAHANFHVNPKAWISESTTLQRQSAGDYVDLLYDTLDGEGMRRLGRLFNTDVLQHDTGRSSLLLDRELDIVNSSTSSSPLVLASALTYAIRPMASVPLRQMEFVIDLEDQQSAGDLGDFLGLGADSGSALLSGAAIGGGTRTVVDYRGTVYKSVLFRNAKEELVEVKAEGSDRTRVHVTAVQVG